MRMPALIGKRVVPRKPAQAAAAAVSLTQALDLAYRSIKMVSAPEPPLGTSLVLLLTGSSIESPDRALEQAVHNNAVNGINLSVATLGVSASGGVWRRLVLAGQ